jgi:hypothetical protein
MNAQVAAPEQTVNEEIRPALIRLLRCTLIAAIAMLWFVAAWMCVRRATGQLQRPLGFLPLLTVGAALVSTLALLRLGWRSVVTSRSRWLRFIAYVAPTAATIMLAVALSMPGTPTSALFAFWGMLFVSELLWWCRGWQRDSMVASTGVRSGTVATAVESSFGASERVEAAIPPQDTVEHDEIDNGPWMAEGMTQQLTRIDAPDGTQSMEGVLRSQFRPRERSRSLHVAFCPPLQTVPDTTVTQLSGPRCHIKAADVQTYGARFDIRLSTASESNEEVFVHFHAIAVSSPLADAEG